MMIDDGDDGDDWQFSTWAGSPEKAPTSLKNTLFSPQFTQVFYDLRGPFLGCQPKWKLADDDGDDDDDLMI